MSDGDRELLELAAKAAGYRVHIWGEKGQENCARTDVDVGGRWNPLTDDGDALRLAVKLRLKIQITEHGAAVRIGFENLSLVALDETADVESATRRAITRAAAEIGRSMK